MFETTKRTSITLDIEILFWKLLTQINSDSCRLYRIPTLHESQIKIYINFIK
jgi:hypothetical protein